MPRRENPYIEDLEQEKIELNHGLHSFCNDYLYKLAYIEMCPMNSDDYYENKKDRKPFKPRKTPLKRVEKDEGISAWLKFKAAFSDDAKKELDVKKKKANNSYEIIKKREDERNKILEEQYYEKQAENHRYYDALKIKAKNNYEDGTIDYFMGVLLNDRYALGNGDYQIECSIRNYDWERHELSICYRLPNPDEIVNIKEFKIDKKSGEIIPILLSKKGAKERNSQIMRMIMLRVVALVYLSDTYKNINSLKVCGYISYYDSYYRKDEYRDVAYLNITKQDFARISRKDLDIYSIDELFEELSKEKKYRVSSSLYSDDILETRSIYE